MRHRQRRKDPAAEAAWPKGQHTYSGIRREDSVHAGHASERVKMGTAIPSWSVCGDAELVIRGSGCHGAGISDQDKVGEHQESLQSERWDADRILEMRGCQQARAGTRTEYSECEPFPGPQMAVTMHLTFKSEWRDPRRWC